jgi:Chitin binding Peritrophin-A domain
VKTQIFLITILCFALKSVFPDGIPDIPDKIFIDCGDAPSGSRIPHPDSCSFYFFCTNDRSYLQVCGEGLLFDAATLRCQIAENAECAIRDSTVMTTENTTESTTESSTEGNV